MTTNQTIDGVLVSRELLELAFLELEDRWSWAGELRALLDASANSAMKGLEAWQSGRDGMRQERDEALGKVETLKSDNAKLADDRTRLSTELEILRPAYRSVLAQLDAAQPQGAPVAVVMSFDFEHPSSKERRTVALSRQDVFDGMEDYFYDKIGEQICRCESVGETNVVDCSCDEYVHDFEIVKASLTS